MGVPSVSFVDTYSRKVTDLMISLVEYVQAMDNILNPSNPAAGTTTNNVQTPKSLTNLQLDKTPNDYPILPDPIPSEGWKKGTWDELFTDYLSQMYHLACGGQDKHIPYKLIMENQREFIDPKYLPRKMAFRSPHNTGFNEMKALFDHFLKRQSKYGPEDTFKFKSIKFRGEIVPAQYVSIDSDVPEPVPDITGPVSSGPGPITVTVTDVPVPETDDNTNTTNRPPPREVPKRVTRSNKNLIGTGPEANADVSLQPQNTPNHREEGQRPKPRPLRSNTRATGPP